MVMSMNRNTGGIAIVLAALLAVAITVAPQRAVAQRGGTATPITVRGLQGLVVDMDGSVESLTALATIARHSEAKTQLVFVSIVGNAWSSAYDAQNLVRRLLIKLGLPSVPVFRGATASLSEAYNTSTYATGCAGAPWVPQGPSDITTAAGAVPISRFDVDTAFGAAELLTYTGHLDLPDRPAEDAFLELLSSIRSGYARVKYLSFSGLTNMALALRKASATSSDLFDVLVSRVTLVMHENGNNMGLDPVAAREVLTTNYLHRLVHTQVFTESVRFDVTRWQQMQSALSMAVLPVQWLIKEAMGGMKAQLDAVANNPTAFFRRFSLGAPLVALCAIDSDTKATFGAYPMDVREVVGVFSNVAPSAAFLRQYNDTALLTVNSTTLRIAPAVFVAVIPDANHIDGTDFYNVSAAVMQPGASETLVNTFWRRWFSVLGL